MTRFTKIAVLALAATALATGIAVAGPHGPGYGMGYGMGYGRDCPFAGEQAAVDLKLTAQKVKTLLEARLIRHGNERLKVGQVVEKDAKTIAAEIVTVDGSLVEKIEIDKATGAGLMGRRAHMGGGWGGGQKTPQPKTR
ncbi:MAG: hypothetical protein FJX42_06960 [Alphaproteobacteria bacterium]|nr:hypothetical protein [Alphaproteobacteria bacterium]